MIFIFIQVLIIVLIAMGFYFSGKQTYNRRKEAGYGVSEKYDWTNDALAPTIFTFVICLIINTFIVVGSYNGYINIKSYKSVIQTTAETIVQYDKDTSPAISAAFTDIKVVTDFKYIDYQKTRAELLKALKEKINEYNTTIIEKNMYKENQLYNWLIIAPDAEDKVITMEEVFKNVK